MAKVKSDAYMAQKNVKKRDKRKVIKQIKSNNYITKKNEKKRDKRKIIKQIKNEVYIEKKKKSKDNRNRIRSDYFREYKNDYRKNKSIGLLLENFDKIVKQGPTNMCICCEGLWFTPSIEVIRKNDATHSLLMMLNVGDGGIFCKTCIRVIEKNKIPKLAMINGFVFPTVPPELEGMTELEERLVSPRIVFMQIRTLGVDGQFGLKGSVVNVPINVQSSIDVLPRQFDQCYTIQLRLKRMLEHKSSVYFESIRPAKVFTAAKYLVNTELFMVEGVTLCDLWPAEHNAENELFIADRADKELLVEAMEDDEDEEEEEEEDEVQLNPNGNETLWEKLDPATDVIDFAPGQGKIPVSLLKDKYVEELSFPTIYCGQPRKLNPEVKISYADICRSELRHFDRRCCKVPKIFFMFKKWQVKNLCDAISICLRKTKNTDSLTAGAFSNDEFINKLIQHDDGFRILAQDRASPAYWSNRRKELFAMIRQLGIPTFFLTLSAAEMKWPELLVILMRTVRNKVISEDEAMSLDTRSRYELISADPVTCSRYFDMRYRELFKVLHAKNGPFGEHELVDYYIRVEFQHRGSPHVHCLLWLKGAPQFVLGDANSISKCVSFIDRFIATSGNDAPDDIKPYVQYLFHKHSKSCRKSSMECRFGIPYPPLPKTMIFKPISNISEEDSEIYCEKLVEIKEALNTIKVPFPFEDFLVSLGLNYTQYLIIIRSQLKRPKIFYRREVLDCKVNSYNYHILKMMRANIDFQFVLDPYSCAHYMLDYVSKAQRGMSALLKQAVEEVNAGNLSIREKIRVICNKYVNSTEISAQEAVYHLLGMQMSRCSRSSIFINTGPPSERVRLVKGRDELAGMDPDSQDIVVANILDHYGKRPLAMENVTLTEFCVNYNYSKKSTKSEVSEDYSENVDEEIANIESGETFRLLHNSGYVQKRNTSKVIRYRRYNKDKDEFEFYREKAMLFVPWRDEQKELIDVDIKNKYLLNIDTINELEKQFVFSKQCDIEEVYREVEDSNDENEPDLNTENPFKVYASGSNICDIGFEFNQQIPKPTVDIISSIKLMPTETYLLDIWSLNAKQGRYLLELMHRVKGTSQEQLFHAILGGAGTGKSKLIQAIYQSMSFLQDERWPKCRRIDARSITVRPDRQSCA